MYKSFLIFILMLPILSQGIADLTFPVFSQEIDKSKEVNPIICFEAYDECDSKCLSPAFYNFKYFSKIDIKDDCRRACKQGEETCNKALKPDQCSGFENKCKENCSTITFDDSVSQDLITDAKNLCEQACIKGKDACKSN